MDAVNRQVRLAARPVGLPKASDWELVEEPAAHVPGARRARCLVAHTETVARRIWDYPADWLTCPARELLLALEGR